MIIECSEQYVDELNEMLKYFNVHITERAFRDEPFSFYYVYQVDHEVIAMISYAIMYERAELNYIYVKPAYRGTQVGSLLMKDMIKRCADKKVEAVTLEVRSGNTAAIQLYKKHGFEEISIRKNYYQNEDGILMEKVL